MASDKQLTELNQLSYQVDPEYPGKTIVAKPDSEVKEDEMNTLTPPDGQAFKVIATSNQKNGSGFQGMAVAPISNNFPNGDRSQTIVVAAGTDPKGLFQQ
ncbi:MAG: hypothetical protein LBI13_10220 [Streptococcaceae bacterium]|jgi:hypothetical protein|nr:hypothetical protein [Streptococcaceae bacterium]